MSAAAVANGPITTVTPLPTPPTSAADLEDLLYDILAGGGDPSLAQEVQQAVQDFLHEHARQRKTQEEFEAFFAKHALPTQPERTLLTLPPLESRGRAAETPALQPIPHPTDPPLQQARVRSSRHAWAWPIALAAVAALAYLGWETIEDLRGEVSSVRGQAVQTSVELTRVRAEAAQLRATVREQTEQLQRADQRSERLMQSFGSPLDPNLR
jgi:hypothetical protein